MKSIVTNSCAVRSVSTSVNWTCSILVDRLTTPGRKPELTTLMDFADEAYVACASYIAPNTEGAKLCHMLARYGEFVVRFSAQIAPAAPLALDEDELGELLVKLDDRWEAAMASLPTPSP